MFPYIYNEKVHEDSTVTWIYICVIHAVLNYVHELDSLSQTYTPPAEHTRRVSVSMSSL